EPAGAGEIGVTVGGPITGVTAEAGAAGALPRPGELVVPPPLRIAIVTIAANTAIATRPSASIIRRDSAGTIMRCARCARCAGGCAAIAWPPEYDIGWTSAVEVASRPG